MAATVELKHLESGKKSWHYACDVREILSAPGKPLYEMTGKVKKTGWATPSPASQRSVARQRNAQTSQEERIAKAIVSALAEAGQLNTPAPVPCVPLDVGTDEAGANAVVDALADQPADEESAGLPSDEDQALNDKMAAEHKANDPLV